MPTEAGSMPLITAPETLASEATITSLMMKGVAPRTPRTPRIFSVTFS